MAESNTDRASGWLSSQLTDLRLLHLADSALPIGALAHSFGLESLVAENLLVVANLEAFLRGWLDETGTLEAVFCREALHPSCANPECVSIERWIEINSLLSARKTARESRSGSIVLGRNFLSTVTAVTGMPALCDLGAIIKRGPEQHRSATHYCLAFGLVAGLLGFDEHRVLLTYLHQAVAAMISGCQRLLPLGQTEAARILWNLKPLIAETVRRSATRNCNDVCSFMPLLDWGAMEHPSLSTRLFIS